jgi:hypothetical protein
MEYKGKRTAAGDALTSLIPDLFRLTSLLLTAGDRLVARLELTSARWQILGTVAASERAHPVAGRPRRHLTDELADDILARVQPLSTLIELGPGSGDKLATLLDARSSPRSITA